MKNINLLKKTVLIIAGILTFPVFEKFEDILDVGNQMVAATVFVYAFVFGTILYSFIWGRPSISLILLLAVFCNSSVYAYVIHRQNK